MTGGPRASDVAELLPVPEIVVVGSASRDLTDDDPRGWRLGGAVTYGGLTLARLGVRTGIVMGVDEAASAAAELDLLRDAGADLRLVLLESAPVFRNLERPDRREQWCLDPGRPIGPEACPVAWRAATHWLLAPVADEMPDDWADVPRASAVVALGWQGLLRDLEPDAVVTRRAPRRSRLLSRASIVGLSREDVDTDRLDDLTALLRAGAQLIVTDGPRGGIRVASAVGGPVVRRRFPAIPAASDVDPTGAGDVFLAAYLAATAGHPLGGSGRRGSDLRLAAAAASLVVEGPGVSGVPTLAAVAQRIERALVRGR